MIDRLGTRELSFINHDKIRLASPFISFYNFILHLFWKLSWEFILVVFVIIVSAVILFVVQVISSNGMMFFFMERRSWIKLRGVIGNDAFSLHVSVENEKCNKIKGLGFFALVWTVITKRIKL